MSQTDDTTIPAAVADDTEGHRRMLNDGETGSGEADDTEGHVRAFATGEQPSGTDDEDDTHGHRHSL